MASEEKNQNNIITTEPILENIEYIFENKPINRFKTKPKVEAEPQKKEEPKKENPKKKEEKK